MASEGQTLVEAARGARKTVLLCAPFVKASALRTILDALEDGVADVTLFTRWRPEEVAAGVTDTSVLPMVEAYGGSVLLCDPLHAKLFRFDDEVLVGSANLTGAALGWSAHPNLELLLKVAGDLPAVRDLESHLRRQSITATPEIAEEVERAAALLPTFPRREGSPEDRKGHCLPTLREPRDLFVAYKRGPQHLSRASAKAAARDLSALELPSGLSKEPFEALVGTRLLQTPVVAAIDEMLLESQRFGSIRSVLAKRLELERAEADHSWQTLMRWLLYFLPQRYRRSVPSHSEILVRRDRV